MTKRIEFKAVNLTNFKSFQGRHRFDLARPAGLHYIRGANKTGRLGSNGAGKSTLISDAVTWVLTGRTVAGLRNPDVEPWDKRKDDEPTSVGLQLWVDGSPNAIRRTISPNSLTLNGEDIGQDELIKFMRMDFSLLTNTVILGQGQPLFFDMTPGQKLELFGVALQLDKWDSRSKAASDATTAAESRMAKLDGEVAGLDTTLDTVEDLLTSMGTKAEEWQAELDKRLADAEAELVRLTSKRDALQKNLDGADLQYDGASAERKALQAQVLRLHNTLRTSQVDLDRMQARRRQINASLDESERILEELAAATCPACGQPLHADKAKEQRRQINKQMDAMEAEFDGLDTNDLKARIAEMEKSLKQAESYLAGYQQRADCALRDIQKWGPELAEVKSQIEGLNTARKDREESRNPYAEQARTLRKRRDKLLDDLRDAKDEQAECGRELERSRFWIKGFKDIKLHVIEEVLQELELATAGMIDEVGLVGWDVLYDIERETKAGKTARGIHVSIRSPSSGKKAVRWESWSGGEAQRLKVIGALALSSVLLNHAGVAVDMEVLDEPTMYLSAAEGVADLTAFLADRAKARGSRIYYIDHASIESNDFSSVVMITRDKQGSRIEDSASDRPVSGRPPADEPVERVRKPRAASTRRA